MTTEVEIDIAPRKRGEPPVIRGNLYATLLLNDLFGHGFRGLNFGPSVMRWIRSSLRSSINHGGLNGCDIFWTKRELHRVLHVFNKLRDHPGEVIYVGAMDDEGEQAEATLRHELMHSAQRRLGANGLDDGHAGDPEDFLSHPVAIKASAALTLDLNYADDPDTLVAEIGAHLAEGTIAAVRMGLTEDEGKQLAVLYQRAILGCNGAKAYHEPLLHPLFEQWSLSNEPDFGVDGEAEPRESGGFTPGESTSREPPAAGPDARASTQRLFAPPDRERAGPNVEAFVDTRDARSGRGGRSVAEDRQERSTTSGRRSRSGYGVTA